MDFDLAQMLGAEEGFSTQRLTLYLPNKDLNGRKLKDHNAWVKEGRKLLSLIGGGATAFPPADGNWVNAQGKLLWEQTKILYCYIHPDRFLVNARSLRDFLHRFGRETKQGEVVVEFDGRFFRIKKFQPPPEG